jgi:Glycosyl hydrolase family 65 central catalytic domain
VRLEASFAMPGLGMEPVLLEQDLGAWRTQGTRKGVAMPGAATLRLGDDVLAPDRPFSLRWAWRWRAVLAAHEAAWDARWIASDVLIEGDDESQRAVRFAVYHLTSAANPEDDRVSIGARALTGDAYLGHVFWDTEIYLLPFYTAVWPGPFIFIMMSRHSTSVFVSSIRVGVRCVALRDVREVAACFLTASGCHPSQFMCFVK